MPPQFLFDISGIDLTQVVFDQESIREFNLQRGDMEMLNGIAWVDSTKNRSIGFKNVRNDEFWCAGHIPNRPLLPGVLMIETGAQLASWYTRKFLKWEGFIGFGGVEDCRFRAQIIPPSRLFILAELIWTRHGRICCKQQGVVDGNMVFEATIIGVKM